MRRPEPGGVRGSDQGIRLKALAAVESRSGQTLIGHHGVRSLADIRLAA